MKKRLAGQATPWGAFAAVTLWLIARVQKFAEFLVAGLIVQTKVANWRGVGHIVAFQLDRELRFGLSVAHHAR